MLINLLINAITGKIYMEAGWQKGECSGNPDIVSVYDEYAQVSDLYQTVVEYYDEFPFAMGTCGYYVSAPIADCCVSSINSLETNNLASFTFAEITSIDQINRYTGNHDYCAFSGEDGIIKYVKASNECVYDHYLCSFEKLEIYPHIECLGNPEVIYFEEDPIPISLPEALPEAEGIDSIGEDSTASTSPVEPHFNIQDQYVTLSTKNPVKYQWVAIFNDI